MPSHSGYTLDHPSLALGGEILGDTLAIPLAFYLSLFFTLLFMMSATVWHMESWSSAIFSVDTPALCCSFVSLYMCLMYIPRNGRDDLHLYNS